MRPATGWVIWVVPRQAAATGCVTVIIMFRTVRHMPNGATCPDLVALCYHY